MRHTQGELKAAERPGWYDLLIGKELIAAAAHKNSEANAARLCLCWNLFDLSVKLAEMVLAGDTPPTAEQWQAIVAKAREFLSKS